MVTKVISIDDGRRQTTVNDLVENPTMVPSRIVDGLRDKFIADTLLYNGGKANTLEFSFERNVQNYVDADPEFIGEFGRFPTVHPTTGEKTQGMANKLGYRVPISRESKDYNKIELVNKAIKQAQNRFIRYNDKLLWDAMLSANIPTIAASVPWDQEGADTRYDIAAAISQVNGGEVLASDSVDIFDADTAVLPKTLTPMLMAQKAFTEDYRGNVADKNIRFTGKLDSPLVGLDALGVSTLRDRVLVLQRGVTGFIKDPRPLEATALRGEGDDLGGDTETYSSRVSQIRFVGIDEPFSACWITGVIS